MHGKSCGTSLGTEDYLYASLIGGERVLMSVPAWLHLILGLGVAEPWVAGVTCAVRQGR